MSCPQTWSCNITYQRIYHQFPFEANPDIAGTGVILAFLVTGWLSFIVSVLGYAYLPNELPGTQKQLDSMVLRFGATVAKHIKKPFKHLFNKSPDDETTPATDLQREGRVQECIHAFAAMLGDTQLVTGTAILVAAYVNVCSLSTYHFQIVTLYALIALSTLQSTSSMCVEHYREAGPMQIWRLVWFLVFIGLCIVTNVIYLTIDIGYPWMPLQCYLDVLFRRAAHPYGTTVDGKVVILLGTSINFAWAFIIMFGVGWTTVRILYFMIPKIRPALFPVIYGFRYPAYQYLFLRRICTLAVGLFPAIPVLRWLAWAPLSLILLPFWLWAFLSRMTFLLMESRGMDVARAYGFLLMATIMIPSSRKGVSHTIVGSEDGWQFGQILPMMLLGLPLSSLVDAYQRSRHGSIISPGTKKLAITPTLLAQPTHIATTAVAEAKEKGAAKKRKDTSDAPGKSVDINPSEDSKAPPKQKVRRVTSSATTLVGPNPQLGSQESFEVDCEAAEPQKQASGWDLNRQVVQWEEYYDSKMWFQILMMIWLASTVAGLTMLAVEGLAI